MNTYTFKNLETGEIRKGLATSMNLAARSIGLDVPFRGNIPEPWKAIECRDGAKLIWSRGVDSNGD
jgi:hypothetical protein